MTRAPHPRSAPRRPPGALGIPGLLAFLALAACAGGAAGPAAPAAAPSAPSAAEMPHQRTAVPAERGQRLFEEAVAAEAELRKRDAPIDWELLSRKWLAVADASDLPEAWFNLGVCLERQGRKAEAAAAWRRALERQPAFREAAANLALASEPEEPRAALQHWEGFMRRFPDDALGRARLASLNERAGRHDEAARLAREALLRDPKSLPALKVMLRVALSRKNFDLAHLLALRAQKLDPSDPELPTAIGRILLAQGDEAAAAAQWRRALQLQPGHAPARVELLRLELGKQHWAGVAEQARALLQADPTDARAQLALGVALRYLGEADQAAAAYDAAERLSGGRLPEVHLARGVLLARVREQCVPALAELKRYAVAAGPSALADGEVGKLERECEQVLAAGRAAEEEARRMKAAEEKKAQPAGDEPRKPGP